MSYYSYRNIQSMDTDPETEVACPFNPNHRMPSRTFNSHVVSCPSRPDYDFSICPYNLRHVVDSNDFQEHLANCPDKASFPDSAVAEEEEPLIDFRNFRHATVQNDGEDWDQDVPVRQYDYSRGENLSTTKRTFNQCLHTIPQKTVESIIASVSKEHDMVLPFKTDYVSMLNQLCQILNETMPKYMDCKSDFPNSFCCSCTVRGQKIVSFGSFKTKKLAKQNAAMWAIVFLNNKYIPDDYRMDVLVSVLPEKTSSNSAPPETNEIESSVLEQFSAAPTSATPSIRDPRLYRSY